MKKFLLGTVALIALSAAANAADLAARPYTKAPVTIAPVYNWGGFYVGGMGGYAWGDAHQDDGAGSTTGTYHPKGGFGGGTLGYNWQFSQWVLGIETDIAGADIKKTLPDSPALSYGCAPLGCESKIDWFGTTRGRLGYTWNSVLFYGTGGVAYGRVHTEIVGSSALIGAPFYEGTTTRTGWAAGGGIEWMFAQNWSAKVEYLHIDLGSHFAFGTATPQPFTSAKFDTIKAGINYHFNWGGPVVARY